MKSSWSRLLTLVLIELAPGVESHLHRLRNKPDDEDRRPMSKFLIPQDEPELFDFDEESLFGRQLVSFSLSMGMSMSMSMDFSGRCPCLGESAVYRDLWLDAVAPAGPSNFFLEDPDETRIQINIENGDGLLLCDSVPAMVFVNGLCNFQAPNRFEDATCRSEGWTGPRIENTDGELVRFDRLLSDVFQRCIDEISDIWGVTSK